MLQSELLGGASLEALTLLLASSYALAEKVKLWRAGAAVARSDERADLAVEEELIAASARSRRRAEAMRPRGLSHCLSRVETPRIVRIRGQ
ncbi:MULTISPECIES: hypothetical protein [Methylosinus]|uniref:Uncharacterized protein n=1 Tax=Methylosinus trichosporium (strain ATCC 35070 / NCIMB 11131 / UNIQEM 75 / OB3b) TaxID=595536 RepID=A0A2D2CW62_METT3|nr:MULTISPECIES: hypothetical protein [Methylosinus]ATQ66960.1 hypothetical protein CQW49_02965 [Methylosinus trichosporium OB3b]OBS54072.1 hypothetical protein A8B73_02175 [Methylosinus sp. 3S-1]